MGKIKAAAPFILGCLVIAALIYAIGIASELIVYISKGAKQLKPNEYVPLFVAVVSAFIGLTGALYTQNRIRLREVEEAHRKIKTEIYFEYITLIQSIMLGAKPEFSDQKPNDKDMVLGIAKFKSKCLLWGSPDVLLALVKFEAQSSATNSSPKQQLQSIEPLYRAMRSDIGLSNSKLPQDFFAKWPLSNPAEFDELK